MAQGDIVYAFKVRVGVVLIRDDRLLLVRQNNRPFWVLPGGTLEPGEGLAECARREMKEETGLDVTIARLLYIADFIRTESGRPEKQTIDAFFLASEPVDGTRLPDFVMETTENINDMGFFTREECAMIVEKNQLQPALAARRILDDWENGFTHTDNNPYLGLYRNDD